MQEAGLQEGFILAGPYHSSHIVRGPQDSLQIYPRSEFIHRNLDDTENVLLSVVDADPHWFDSPGSGSV